MTPLKYGVGYVGTMNSCNVRIYPDGTVQVSHSGAEVGQGINTKVAQVVAVTLGVTSVDLVKVTNVSTNQTGGNETATGGSSTSELCVQAALNACAVLTPGLSGK